MIRVSQCQWLCKKKKKKPRIAYLLFLCKQNNEQSQKSHCKMWSFSPERLLFHKLQPLRMSQRPWWLRAPCILCCMPFTLWKLNNNAKLATVGKAHSREVWRLLNDHWEDLPPFISLGCATECAENSGKLLYPCQRGVRVSMPSHDTPVKGIAKQWVISWKKPLPWQPHRAYIKNTRNNLESHQAHEKAGPFATHHPLAWGISVQREVARGMTHFLVPEGSSQTAEYLQAWGKVIFCTQNVSRGPSQNGKIQFFLRAFLKLPHILPESSQWDMPPDLQSKISAHFPFWLLP